MNAALEPPLGGLVLTGRRIVSVTGADRVDYLHRMLTQDIAGLGAGRGAPACYLSVTGRILAHMLVWNLGERLLLDVAPGASPAALPALERYVIADDVVFEEQSAASARALLVGSSLGVASAVLPLTRLAALGQIEALDVAGERAWILPLHFGGRVALHVLTQARAAAAVFAALARGAAPWTQADLDAARVEEGVPAAGAELDERILPNEARLEDAISYAKGCFPGQEPMVMARDRGHPPTLLVRLTLATPTPPLAGAALLDGERAVGRLTTVATGRDGRAAALGFVRHALARSGQRLGVAGGGTAEVL